MAYDLDKIQHGDRVTIRNAQGQEHTGKAQLRGPAGWVLNMGGAHGRPGIAHEGNIVKHIPLKLSTKRGSPSGHYGDPNKDTEKNRAAAKARARGTSTGYMVPRPGLGLPMPPPPMPMQQGPAPMGAGAPAPAPQGGAPVRMPTPKRPPASSAQLPDDNMNAIA